MQFQRAGPALDLLDQPGGQRSIALAGKGEIHGQGIGGLDHAREMPGARRAGGGVGAGGRSRAAAEHGGDAGMERLLHLLGADEMDMGVHAAGGEYLAFPGNGLG